MLERLSLWTSESLGGLLQIRPEHWQAYSPVDIVPTADGKLCHERLRFTHGLPRQASGIPRTADHEVRQHELIKPQKKGT